MATLRVANTQHHHTDESVAILTNPNTYLSRNHKGAGGVGTQKHRSCMRAKQTVLKHTKSAKQLAPANPPTYDSYACGHHLKYCKDYVFYDALQCNLFERFFCGFRYANYFVINDVLHRTLIKAYGIRFVILVYGEVMIQITAQMSIV